MSLSSLLVARESMNTYPGLNFNQGFSFQLCKIIFTAIFVEFEIIRFKSEGQKYNQKTVAQPKHYSEN